MSPAPDTILAERHPAVPEDAPRGGLGPPPGEWLFERAGEVFGPVSGARLVALLDEGSIHGGTRVRSEAGEWRTLASTPVLLPQLRAAQARARRAAEARRSARRARWSASARWTAWTILIGAVVVAVAAAAAYLSVRRPWHTQSALLADFGQGIRVTAVHVGGERVGQREIAVPDLRDPGRRGLEAAASATRSRSTANAPPTSAVASRSGAAPEGESFVAAQYDRDRIERTVAPLKGRLAGCVRDEAQRSPDLSGTIPIEFAIENDGRVGELWIEDARFRSGPLRECLLGVLRASSFHPFAGQRPVVSFAFQIGPR